MTRCVICLSIHNRGAVISEDGRLRLCTGVQSHLALCCKTTLPILCMGHVRVHTDHHELKRRLLQATRCLTKQPGGVSHFEVTSKGACVLDTRNLIDLRCATLWCGCPLVL